MGTSSQDLQDSLDQAFDMVGDESVAEATTVTPPARRKSRTTRARSRNVKVDVKLSSVPQYLGILLILAAFGVAAAKELGVDENALTIISRIGITPGLLLVAGILLAGLAWLQSTGLRSTARVLSQQMGSELTQIGDEVQAMAEEARNANPNAVIEDQLGEQVQILAKVETMIANLTKAVRMHNKPLVDIVGMVTDLDKQGTQTQQQLSAVQHDLEAIERGLGESTASNEKHWEGMYQRLHGSENEIESCLEKSREVTFERLESHIERENKRLASEVETYCDMLREQLEQAIRNIESTTNGAIESVSSRVEKLANAPSKAALDPQVFSGLERNLERVRDTVELLASRPAAAPAAASASTSASTAPTLGTERPTRSQASAPSSSSSATAAPTSEDAEGVGKNVMSAIERLKKMRGA